MSEPRPPAREGRGGSDAALRALHAARDEAAELRAPIAPEAARGRVLRVANSVDRALRRLLRDDERASLEVRLSALAVDEIDAEAVLGELRSNDRIALETAAEVHSLYDLRRRLEDGLLPEPQEAQRTADLFGRLASELGEAPAPTPAFVARSPLPAAGFEPLRETGAPFGDPELDDALATPPSRPRRARGRRNPIPIIGLGVVVLLLAIVLMIRGFGGSSAAEMERGIALFRTGEYAEAAQHFWRYAEANPDDATPHLYLARIHRRMERPALAADAIREAQALAPDDPAVHRELGFLLIDTEQPEAAIERFRTAIELDPESTEGYVGLVRSLREADRADEIPAVLADAPADARALLQAPPEP